MADSKKSLNIKLCKKQAVTVLGVQVDIQAIEGGLKVSHWF